MEIISNICFEKELSNTKKINDKIDFLRLWHNSHWINVLFLIHIKCNVSVDMCQKYCTAFIIPWWNDFRVFGVSLKRLKKPHSKPFYHRKWFSFFLLNAFFIFKLFELLINIFTLDCYLFYCFKEVKKTMSSDTWQKNW